jgi:hypothetical protein
MLLDLLEVPGGRGLKMRFVLGVRDIRNGFGVARDGGTDGG